MAVKIIDDISKYSVSFSLSKDSIDDLDSIDLLFFKGLLKTTKNKDCKFLFPIFQPYAILIRILFYSLMDYRELIGTNEFKTFQFVDWLSAGKKYRNYLILVWITKKLKELKKDEYYFQKYQARFNNIDKLKESNLQDFNVFDLLNLEEYKKSTLRNYTMNKTKINRGISILSNSVFIDIFDKQSSTNISMYLAKDITDKTRIYEVIKLNRAFFQVQRRFEDNWLF